MPSLRLTLALFALLLAGPAAFADTADFALSGRTLDGVDFLQGTFSGTVSIDSATGDLLGANFRVMADGASDLFSGLPGSTDTSPFYTGYTFTSSSGDQFLLALPTTTLAGYTGGDICSLSDGCSDSFYVDVVSQFALNSGTFDPAYDGQLTPMTEISSTPEPSTLPLLATGLFGVVCVVRGRRLMV
jgi:hypothetical protein